MATSDDRERLEAIANAIMAPHVIDQQNARMRIQGRREGFLRRNRIFATGMFLVYLGYILFKVVPDGDLDVLSVLVLALLGWTTFKAWRRTE
jgi:hypothetical protein